MLALSPLVSTTDGPQSATRYLTDAQERLPDCHLAARLDSYFVDGSGTGGSQFVLHFHRFEDDQGVILTHLLARDHGHLDDQPGYGRPDDQFAGRGPQAA